MASEASAHDQVGLTATAPRGHPLRSHAFRFIWLGLIVSLVGDQLYRMALTITLSSRGAAGLASLGLALALPTAVFGLACGVFIDRHDKFRLLVGTDLARAAIVAALGVVFLAARAPLALTLTLATSLALVSVLFTPAMQALMPELASDKARIISMDTWIIGSVSVISVIGPALGGSLLQVLPARALMWLDGVTFVWSAGMLMHARRILARPAMAKSAVPAAQARWSGVVESIAFLLRHRVLRPCFTTFPVMEFALYAIPFMLPLLLTGSPRHTAALYGICLAALGTGRVAGLAIVNRTQLRRYRGWVLRVNFLVQGGALLTLAALRTPVVMVSALAYVGIASGAAQVAMASYVQLEVLAEMRGRVFGGIISIVSWLQPFGAVTFGAIAAATSPASAMGAMGVLVLLGGIRLFACRPLAEVH